MAVALRRRQRDLPLTLHFITHFGISLDHSSCTHLVRKAKVLAVQKKNGPAEKAARIPAGRLFAA